jgi:hypothetical protein
MNAYEPLPHAVYDPNRFIDELWFVLDVQSDKDLARILGISRSAISKFRHLRAGIPASILVQVHLMTGMSIKMMRDMMGDRRVKYRLSGADGLAVKRSYRRNGNR